MPPSTSLPPSAHISLNLSLSLSRNEKPTVGGAGTVRDRQMAAACTPYWGGWNPVKTLALVVTVAAYAPGKFRGPITNWNAISDAAHRLWIVSHEFLPPDPRFNNLFITRLCLGKWATLKKERTSHSIVDASRAVDEAQQALITGIDTRLGICAQSLLKWMGPSFLEKIRP